MRTRVIIHGGRLNGKMFDLNCGIEEAVIRVYSELGLFEDQTVSLEAERLY